MNNEIDVKFNTITECASRILSFQADLKEEKDASKIEFLNYSIEEQKKLIEEYVDSSVAFVLRFVEKINSSKQKFSEEQEPEKRKILENTINTYSDMIKSKINDKALIEENTVDKANSDTEKQADKFTQYRASQKYDTELLKLSEDVTKMCEKHQKPKTQKYDLELLKRSKDISKMCEEHQAELKSQENHSEMDERE